MLPLLAFIIAAPTLDGEGAADAAKQFLTRMNVRGIKGLSGLALQDGRNWQHPGKVWSVSFDLENNGYFSVLMSPQGRVFYASGKTVSGRVDPAKAQQFAKLLIARVPGAIPVKLDGIGTNAESGASAATFKAVLDGRTFFNLNPTYGYYIQFDAKGGLTWFGRQDELPTPIARTAKISNRDAVRRLEKFYWDGKPTTWPYPRHVEAELGYYKLKTEPKARLVWHGQVFTVIGRQNSQFATIDTMVDAVTGQLVKADDRY